MSYGDYKGDDSPNALADFKTKYTLHCSNASVAVHLYGALCLQPQQYGDRIDKSERGYLLWLYAGNAPLAPQLVKLLNVALEDSNISIRVRREIVLESPALGRRQFLGNRFVLRLERPGLEDLIGDDGLAVSGNIDSVWGVEETFTTEHYVAMGKYFPRVAHRHLSYGDVDIAYDLVFKPLVLIRGTGPQFTCCIVQNNKEIGQLGGF
jgi:hypothetical protein